ncbi:MAG: TetR family transcriptional regulator [Phenylobacterium zucineum]|nr:MAG: TetR family transcriptional regulator [Phenylobacterium zucineum]
MTLNPIQPNRRTQAERRAESEHRLLHAAAEIVVSVGLTAATFENVGRRAGYSRGLAAQKFGSKQGLVEALVAHLESRQAGLWPSDPNMPGLESILGYVDAFLRNLGHDGEARAYFMLMSGAVSDLSPHRTDFAQVHERVERRLESLVKRGQDEGNISSGLDADAMALMIGALLLGVSMQVLVNPSIDINPIRMTSLAALRQALVSRP